jgi:pantoate--beta-alanine ligase
MIIRTSGRIDYIECADAQTLRPVPRLEGRCVIALAVFFGKARLIDNIILQI